jgi:MraZ protein
LAFHGRHEHSLDSKDRLTVPSRFRAALGEELVLVPGLDPCVWAFPAESYPDFTKQVLSDVNPLGAKGRMLRRHFHGNASNESLDSAGRVRIPKHLLEHAGLEGPCVLIGMEGYFEIWSPGEWEKAETEMKTTVGEVAEGFAEAD